MLIPRPAIATLFPYTTLFRSRVQVREVDHRADPRQLRGDEEHVLGGAELADAAHDLDAEGDRTAFALEPLAELDELDRKSTRLNSSHVEISYAVLCLKKKTKK